MPDLAWQNSHAHDLMVMRPDIVELRNGVCKHPSYTPTWPQINNGLIGVGREE